MKSLSKMSSGSEKTTQKDFTFFLKNFSFAKKKSKHSPERKKTEKSLFLIGISQQKFKKRLWQFRFISYESQGQTLIIFLFFFIFFFQTGEILDTTVTTFARNSVGKTHVIDSAELYFIEELDQLCIDTLTSDFKMEGSFKAGTRSRNLSNDE